MKRFLVMFIVIMAILCSCVYTSIDLPRESQIPVLTYLTTQTPDSTPTPILTLTPKPTPKPTEAPLTFEQLAPTVLMGPEELVGNCDEDRESFTDWPPVGTYKLYVNIYYQIVIAYKKGITGEYDVPVRYMLCSTGKSDTPTPLGSFFMGTERVGYGSFKRYPKYWAQYECQLTEDILFHSVLYKISPNQKNYDPYKGPDPSYYSKSSCDNLGGKASHGCIRLFVPDARWIWYHVAPGSPVYVDKGKKNKVIEEIKNQLEFRIPEIPKGLKLKRGVVPITEQWFSDLWKKIGPRED